MKEHTLEYKLNIYCSKEALLRTKASQMRPSNPGEDWSCAAPKKSQYEQTSPRVPIRARLPHHGRDADGLDHDLGHPRP